MTNAFAFSQAVRTNTSIILALAGSSGSGKTRSALELAVGLAGPDGKILLIDTEGRRALHYADDYRFLHYEWRPPFTPDALAMLFKASEAQKVDVIIVDSMSDEHEGEGGLCDMAEAELAKQRGENKNSAAAWARPKAEHKAKIVRWLRQTRCHVIFCLRADERVRFEKIEKDGRERTVVVPMGWTPIAEKRLLYDVTTSLLFTPDRQGFPTPIKLYDKHAPFFPRDRQVSREAGARLALWAAGGAAAPPPDVREERAAPAQTNPSAQTQAAIAVAQRIRKQIAEAQFIEQLNERGIFGPSAADDERLIKAEPRGDVVWDDLVRRDAARRRDLAPLPDDPIPDLAPDYRI